MRLPFLYAAIVETIAGVGTYVAFSGPLPVLERIAGVGTYVALSGL